jgi:hypothetical protein
MQKIKSNKIQCNFCKDIIESTFRHDFVTCSCGKVAIDGGKDYLRRCYENSRDEYTELSETYEIIDHIEEL